ncbi:MAG: hypothetical protein RLY23_327 [Actinomycetota bacterium]|jgi:acetolactate synthase-1/2/3 large subunit
MKSAGLIQSNSGQAIRSIGDLLRPLSAELADLFDDAPIPAALAFAINLPSPEWEPQTAQTIPAGAKLGLIAGPEVLRFHAISALQRLARSARIMVANTWGAKGVFNWADPHHMGTVGLQADDFRLLNFHEIDLVIAFGADPLESPDDAIGCEVLHIHPLQIEKLSIPLITTEIDSQKKPPLFTAIADIAQPGYLSNQFPRHPARCVMDVKRSVPPGGIVVVEPGPLGLWFARTFPTEAPGTIIVPAWSKPGAAAAIGLISAIYGHHATVITSSPMDHVSAAIQEIGAAIEAPLKIEEWGPADIDLSVTESLIAVAGEVIAWRT